MIKTIITTYPFYRGGGGDDGGGCPFQAVMIERDAWRTRSEFHTPGLSQSVELSATVALILCFALAVMTPFVLDALPSIQLRLLRLYWKVKAWLGRR